MKYINPKTLGAIVTICLFSQSTYAAIALDRTRVLYNEGERSVSMMLENENESKPYLAQSWLENSQDEKINSPFIVTPPVQRIEAGNKSQIKIQALPATNMLPTDRESIYYLNVREIPPRSDSPNVLQIALQTKIKVFYRPKSIVAPSRLEANPMEKDIVIEKQSGNYNVKNPSPYYLTITKVRKNNTEVKDFEAVMIEPFGQRSLGTKVGDLGTTPTLEYLNDFGGLVDLTFQCRGDICSANIKDKKA